VLALVAGRAEPLDIRRDILAAASDRLNVIHVAMAADAGRAPRATVTLRLQDGVYLGLCDGALNAATALLFVGVQNANLVGIVLPPH
jgi:hypothetical protein